MKTTLRQRSAALWSDMRSTLVGHFVELTIVLYSCIIAVGAIIKGSDPTGYSRGIVCAAPVALCLAYILNVVIPLGKGRRWRPLYPLCFMLPLLLGTLTAVQDWHPHTSFFVTVIVVCPLSVLICRRKCDNADFVSQALAYVLSGAVSTLLSAVAFGAFFTIFDSVLYIFGIECAAHDTVVGCAAVIFMGLLNCWIFLSLSDRLLLSRIRLTYVGRWLLDYILAPALLIYLAIIYLYIIKSGVTWSLPKGGVAYLVFGFTTLAFAVKALQLLLENRSYRWFFDRLGILSLPAVVLFWIGVAERIDSYGLTESRVYLLVCGAVMTLCVVQFLPRHSGKYITVTAATIALFALFTYLPPISSKQMGIKSQCSRAERAAAACGLLDDNGKMLLQPLSDADTTHREALRTLYTALEYLGDYNSTLLNERFGITNAKELLHLLPEGSALLNYVRFGEDNSQENVQGSFSLYRFDLTGATDISGYNRMQSVTDQISTDTLKTADLQLPIREVVEQHLQRLGYAQGSVPDDAPIGDHAAELLEYRTDSLLVIFSDIRYTLRNDSLVLETLTTEQLLRK